MSTTAEPWRDPASELKAFAKALSLNCYKVYRSEKRDAFRYNEKIAPAQFPKLSDLQIVLRTLVLRYGQCVSLTLSEGDVVVFSLDPHYKATNLGHLYARINAGSELDLFLKIDKKCLLKRWGFNDADCAFALFLFPEALGRAIDVPLIDLERAEGLLHGFVEKRKVVVLVPDHDLELTGGHLAVLGGDAVGQWRNNLPVPSVGDPKPTAVITAARNLLKWVHYELDFLTPLHLQLDWKARRPAKNDPIADRLFAQWITCSLLYLGGLSQWDEQKKTWLITFAADKSAAQVDIGQARVRNVLISTDNLWVSAKAIGERVLRVYQDSNQMVDQHTVLQYVLAEALQDATTAANCKHLIRRAPEIAKSVARAWEAFTAQKLSRYFEQVRQFEDLVDTTSRGYDEQVQALTGRLTENMLAALGVVVGSFIAALFTSPFRPFVFCFGVDIYLAYLIAFPIVVGLLTTWGRFKASGDAFNKRKENFSKRLTDVDQIAGTTVKTREKSFKIWFGVTVVLYAIVVVALFVARDIVPGRIQKQYDQFTVTNIEYGRPSAGAVPLIIHGFNFDKDKEIVVIVDSSVYANSAKTVDVYGSSVLTLSVPLAYLPNSREPRFVEVRQGSVMKKAELPRFPGDARR